MKNTLNAFDYKGLTIYSPYKLEDGCGGEYPVYAIANEQTGEMLHIACDQPELRTAEDAKSYADLLLNPPF